jgi:D-alanyl-D-alanine carboxypeptidase/D-alanyl-D-alanine-endopeptidase (penicillin-binding protein 4)
MPEMLRSTSFLLLLSIAGCSTSVPRDDASLHPDLDRLITEAAGDAVQVSALVVSVEDGRLIYRRNPLLLMHPASTLKIVTTAAAIAYHLHLMDAVTEAVVYGGGEEVLLIGGGDPFLSSEDLDELARRLPSGSAVRAVSFDDSLFAGPKFGEGWMWDDEGAPFQPSLSALSVDGGCMTVEVQGTTGETGARGVRKVSVSDPSRHATDTFCRKLTGRGRAWVPGTEIRERLPDPGRSAKRVSFSRPFSEILRRTMKESDNLGAECVLRHLGLKAAGPPGTAQKGLAVVRSYLAELELAENGFHIVDASGVSHYNLVSADLLVRVLRDMASRTATFSQFKGTLPIAGQDGTLQDRMKGTPAEGQILAKTGTIRGVSALAGYAVRDDGEALAFAILIQNYTGPPGPWRALQDRICVRLVSGGEPEQESRRRPPSERGQAWQGAPTRRIGARRAKRQRAPSRTSWKTRRGGATPPGAAAAGRSQPGFLLRL